MINGKNRITAKAADIGGSSLYRKAVLGQIRKKGTTLRSSPANPVNRKYHKDYSARRRARGRG